MNRTLLVALLSLVTFNVFAAPGIVDKSQSRAVSPANENGLDSCRSEIRQDFDRRDQLIFSRKNYVDRSQQTNRRTFYVNATVNNQDAKGRKLVGFACETNFRGDEVVSLEKIDGRYVKSGSSTLSIVSR